MLPLVESVKDQHLLKPPMAMENSNFNIFLDCYTCVCLLLIINLTVKSQNSAVSSRSCKRLGYQLRFQTKQNPLHEGNFNPSRIVL